MTLEDQVNDIDRRVTNIEIGLGIIGLTMMIIGFIAMIIQ